MSDRTLHHGMATRKAAAPRLGLIGGLGPAATRFYYDRLLNAHAEREFAPRLLIAHADKYVVLRAISRGEVAKLANYLAKFANDLAKAGADVVALAAITPHVCVQQLAPQSRVPVVDATESIVGALYRSRLKRVAVFGSKTTMDSDLFGSLQGVVVARPTRSETKRLANIYLRMESELTGPRDVDDLGEIARRLQVEEHADAIVLAGTAFSLIAPELRGDVAFIDCGRVHVDAIMNALSELFGARRGRA